MSAIRSRDRKRHRFPWSLSPGNTGTTVVTQHCKRKRAVLMEEAKTVRRESDTNRCKTRVSSRAFTHREHRCRVKICSPVDMCFLSPLGTSGILSTTSVRNKACLPNTTGGLTPSQSTEISVFSGSNCDSYGCIMLFEH